MITIARRGPIPRWGIALIFVLANLLTKGAFLGINSGEYTDGILQLQSLQMRAGLYPPLYEIFARTVAVFGFSLETAARIVSLIFASLTVVPVLILGWRLGGSRTAAVFAGLFYTLSPMPLRWSVRVMTDAQFLFFSTLALVALTEAWAICRRAVIMNMPKSSPAMARRSMLVLTVATVAVGGAGFTRYQGALLAPLLLMILWRGLACWRRIPWVAVTLMAGFAVAALWWTSINKQVHAGQFTSRTTGDTISTAFAWFNTLESFVLISPYYFGYPLFAAAVAGLAMVRPRAELFYLRPAGVLWGAYGLMLLALHAAFGSFQYRYMMPMVPLVCALAGVGFAGWEEKLMLGQHHRDLQLGADRPTGAAVRRLWFRVALLGSVVYLSIFSLAVIVLQRETYGDQRAAADFLRKNVPPQTPVFSNERYGPYVNFGSVKLSYWSGRRVQVFTHQPLPAGSLLVLGTAYGGNSAVSATLAALETQYNLVPVLPAPLRSDIVPLMDDVMPEPLYNQNPLAWVLRYVPQSFATQIFEVTPKPGPAGETHGP